MPCIFQGLPSWRSGKESACQCRRHRRLEFDSWVGKSPWSRKWQPTLVFLPEKFCGQRSLVGCIPWSHKESSNWETEHTHHTSSVQLSCSVVSDSLQPHESQHTRPPCPSPTPEVHSDSRPSSQCCHPAISSSGVTFSSCPQSLPASESFPMS